MSTKRKVVLAVLVIVLILGGWIFISAPLPVFLSKGARPVPVNQVRRNSAIVMAGLVSPIHEFKLLSI